MKCECGYAAPNIGKASGHLWKGHTVGEHTAYVAGHADGVMLALDRPAQDDCGDDGDIDGPGTCKGLPT